MAFLIWLSRDSTWWTFLFGALALLSFVSRFKTAFDKYHKRFTTKAELMAFVDGLPDDEK